MRRAGLAYSLVAKRRRMIVLVLASLLFSTACISLLLGSASTPLESLRALTCLLSHSAGSLACRVLVEIRLPRIVMAVLAGGCFGVAGCLLQTVLRNPLASPYTIGVSSAASFGAALAIILGAGVVGWWGSYIVYLNPYLVIANAFFFALIASVIVALLAYRYGASPGVVILAGIAVAYVFQAATSLLQYLGSSEQIAAVVFWVFGDLGRAEWLDDKITLMVLLAGLATALAMARMLDALQASEEVAYSLGVNVRLVRTITLVVASILTATPTAFIGVIGFIGLLAPHIARFIIGSKHSYLVPCSMLTGGILLLAADTIARTITQPLILPVGIVTSFMGVPLFLALLVRRGSRYW